MTLDPAAVNMPLQFVMSKEGVLESSRSEDHDHEATTTGHCALPCPSGRKELRVPSTVDSASHAKSLRTSATSEELRTYFVSLAEHIVLIGLSV